MAKKVKRALVVILALVVVAGAVWVGVAANARNSLTIYMDGQAFVCETGTATEYALGWQDDEGSVPAIELTPDLDCTLRFHAANDGPLPLEISQITIPEGGPDTSGGASVVVIDGGNRPTYPLPADATDVSSRDAILIFDDPILIEPGDSQFFQATLAYPPDPFMGDGTASICRNAPSATVSALGISGEREGARGGYAFLGTPESALDS